MHARAKFASARAHSFKAAKVAAIYVNQTGCPGRLLSVEQDMYLDVGMDACGPL